MRASVRPLLWWGGGAATAVVLAVLVSLLVVRPWLERRATEARLDGITADIEAEKRAIPRREAAVRQKLAAAGFDVVEVYAPHRLAFWSVKVARDGYVYAGAFSHDGDYTLRGKKVRGPNHSIRVTREVDGREERWYYEGPAVGGLASLSHIGESSGLGVGPTDAAVEFAGIVWQVYQHRPWPQP